MEIGDIITAYHAGYHQVVDFEGSLIKYVTILDSNGNKKKPNGCRRCHKKFCQRVDIAYIRKKRQEELEKLEVKYKKLEENLG